MLSSRLMRVFHQRRESASERPFVPVIFICSRRSGQGRCMGCVYSVIRLLPIFVNEEIEKEQFFWISLHVCFLPSITHRLEMAYLDKFLHLSIISSSSSSSSSSPLFSSTPSTSPPPPLHPPPHDIILLTLDFDPPTPLPPPPSHLAPPSPSPTPPPPPLTPFLR